MLQKFKDKYFDGERNIVKNRKKMKVPVIEVIKETKLTLGSIIWYAKEEKESWKLDRNPLPEQEDKDPIWKMNKPYHEHIDI